MALAAVLTGCAVEPPLVAVAPVPTEEAIDAPSRIGFESEVGGLPEEAMQKAFASLGKGVEACVGQGYAHVDSLGGHVKVALKIDTSGNLSSVFLSESALGDRATEKCIIDAAKRMRWPHAIGGVGVASTSYDTTPAKERATWDEKKVRPAIREARAQAARCKPANGADFVVTAYVHSDGRVQAAGLSMSNAEADEAADCIVDAVRKVRFGYPGKEAKLSFSL